MYNCAIQNKVNGPKESTAEKEATSHQSSEEIGSLEPGGGPALVRFALDALPRLGFSGASFHMRAIYGRQTEQETRAKIRTVIEKKNAKTEYVGHGFLGTTGVSSDPLLQMLLAVQIICRWFPLGFVGLGS